jgi:hypothetical protein
MFNFKPYYPKGQSKGYTSGAPAPEELPAASTLQASDKTVLEERFPHILDTIQLMWGPLELNLYFDKLIVDDRGNRQGFPTDAWAEIHMPSRVHHELVPQPAAHIKLNFSCG